MNKPLIETLSHHAYAIVGDQTTRVALIEELALHHNVPTKANPDFFDLSFDTFVVDNAREIKSLHDTKPMNVGAKKVFVLTMNGITVEAQNALLKLLEEPASYAHFFFIIPSAHLLLPTVKSRLELIGATHAEKNDLSEAAQQFLAMKPGKRLEYVKEIVDEIAKDTKVKQDAINFLNEVEAVLYVKKGVKNAKDALRAIDHARGYMNDRAPSVKMLLEYVALNV